MKPFDRRRFVLTAAAATAAVRPALRAFAQSAQIATPTAQEVMLSYHPETPGPKIPANFVGLSYETQQLTNPDFFSPNNIGLVAQFRALAPHGVLRLGGNTSDVSWWKPTASSTQPPMPEKVVVIPLRPDERPFQELAYSVTPEAVRNLRGFLDATGWTCLYGINLGTSTPARAADEAAFVAKTLGTDAGGKLEYFQLGNEPDIFYNRFRMRANWSVQAYFDEWIASVEAIRTVVPEARFGLPDTSGSPEWSSGIADRLAALPEGKGKGSRPRIGAISHHYYFTGPPSNPKANPTDLLKPDPKVLRLAGTARAAADKLGVRYRMTEGNTCYRGGRPGMSDVFASSLWAADYLLTLASLGYAGVNLHGGSGKAVADSLGGTLPGELLMEDRTAPHPRPFYTPIAEVGGKFVAEPVFYGLLFAQKFAGTTLIPVDFNPGPVNATAFAAVRPNGTIILAVINKDASRSLTVRSKLAATGQFRLEAASLTSTAVFFKAVDIARNTAEPGSRMVFSVAPGSAVFLEG